MAATAELIIEVGFDKLRIQDVAERAGSGLGTIYRRWKTKEALIADAIRAFPETEYALSSDPAADLSAAVQEKALFYVDNPDLIPGLVAAVRADAGIAEAIRESYSDEPLRKLFARLLGPNHPQVDLLAELVPAVLLHRNLFHGRPIEPEAFAKEVLSITEGLSSGDSSSDAEDASVR